MDPQRWQQIERLFRLAAAAPACDREALIAREAGDDPELVREVRELLACDDPGDASIARAIAAAAHHATADAPSRRRPDRVGPYRIDRALGEGGMGSVWLGSRDDDAFSKQVAIKLLRPGWSGDDLVARFRTERQILATLEHPNISRLLDGGATEDGEPYVVMEYVDGRPILDHCAERRLATRERLELFLKVAAAVAYAHGHSIVHRDIKPSNVLIASTGEPKLLDFGIAKLLEPEALEVPANRTATSMRLMTPQYASPEQVRGEPATPATDVYALGVLLYELLTGRLPYRVDASDPLAIARAVCEEEPPRPSRALSGERVEQEPSLRRTIAGDLDTIALTALDKEPARRYPTVADLAADVRRHLDGLPVRARPATIGYRAGKFFRRRPVHAAFLVTLAVTIPALGFLGARVIQQRRAERADRIETLLREARWLEERRRPREVRRKADEILALAPGHPAALRHRAVSALQLWRRSGPADRRDGDAAAAVADALRVQEVVPGQAWTYTLEAWVRENLDQPGEAARAEARAEALRGDESSEDDLDFSAQLALARGDYAEAVSLLTELITRRPERSSAIASRAFAYEELGDPETAFREYRLAVGIDPDQDLTLVDLGRMSVDRGDFQAAERYLNRAIEIKADNAYAYETLGHLLLQSANRALAEEHPDAALDLLDRSERASRRSLEIDPSVEWAELNVAGSSIVRHRVLGGGDPALLERAMRIYEEAYPPGFRAPAGGQERDRFYLALSNTCDALIQLGRLDEALRHCLRVTEQFPSDAVGYYNLAGVYAALGRSDDALAALERDFELGDDDWEYLSHDAWFESLAEDARFRDLVRRMRSRRAG